MFSLPLSFMLAVLLIAVLPLQHQVRNIQMMIDDFIFSDPFKRRHSGYPLPAQSLYQKQLAVWNRKYNDFPMRPLGWLSPKQTLFSFPNVVTRH